MAPTKLLLIVLEPILDLKEKEGRRLLLASEIAQRKLAVYTPGQYDEDGNILGEVHGVGPWMQMQFYCMWMLDATAPVAKAIVLPRLVEERSSESDRTSTLLPLPIVQTQTLGSAL